MKAGLRLITVALTGALLATSGVAQNQDQPAANGPKLVLSQNNWNFGEVWHGEKPKLTLVITNGGNEPLKLFRLHPSCGCTAAQPEKNEIAPGESTNVEVTFDTNGKFGPVGSSVTIFNNDPDPTRKQYTFQINGNVKRALSFDPIGGVVIRSIDGKAGLVSSCRITNQEQEDMKLTIRAKSAPDFDIEIKEVIPGKVYDLVGTTNKPLAKGTHRGSVSLATGLAREPMTTVFLQAVILPRVELVPTAILVHKQMTDPSRRSIKLEYYGDNKDFRVTAVRCRNDDVKVTVGQSMPPTPDMLKLNPAPTLEVPLGVELPPGEKLGDSPTLLEIDTNDPDFKTVTVTITTDATLFREKMYGEKAGSDKPVTPPGKPAAPVGPPAPTGEKKP